MKNVDAFFVVSAYNNDVSWIEQYTNNYIIYDKSNTLPGKENILKVKNVGYNIYDICHYITNNYYDLPEYIAFLEGWPFDHCRKETFDKLIINKKFTPIEDYSHIPETFDHKKDRYGGYMELNLPWYLQLPEPYKHIYFSSYNDFLDKMFENAKHPVWIRFAPGAQYIVPKENILFYSKLFYQRLKHFVEYDQYPMEAHLIERAFYIIFSNKFKERDR
jgi:hypothetical protein